MPSGSGTAVGPGRSTWSFVTSKITPYPSARPQPLKVAEDHGPATMSNLGKGFSAEEPGVLRPLPKGELQHGHGAQSPRRIRRAWRSTVPRASLRHSFTT